MKIWLLIVPILILGIVALGSIEPDQSFQVSMSNVKEIPGAEGSGVDITEGARKRGHDVAMFGAG